MNQDLLTHEIWSEDSSHDIDRQAVPRAQTALMPTGSASKKRRYARRGRSLTASLVARRFWCREHAPSKDAVVAWTLRIMSRSDVRRGERVVRGYHVRVGLRDEAR